MEPASDWARLKKAYDDEEFWRSKGELAIRIEMERRLEAYFERKSAEKEITRIAAAMSPRPRLVPMNTSGHLNPNNKRNAEAARNGLPREREINQMRRERAANDEPEDIRIWRPSLR